MVVYRGRVISLIGLIGHRTPEAGHRRLNEPEGPESWRLDTGRAGWTGEPESWRLDSGGRTHKDYKTAV